MLKIKRVLGIILFVSALTGSCLYYTWHTAHRTNSMEKNRETVEFELLKGKESDRKDSVKQKYYIYGKGLIQQNISSFCKDAGFLCYSEFLDRNIPEGPGSTVIFATKEPLRFVTPERLEELAGHGVNLVFAAGVPEEKEIQEFLGILERGEYEPADTFSPAEGFLPFMEEKMKNPEYNLSCRLKTDPDVKVLLWDEKKQIPVIYNKKAGKGTVTVFNTELLDNMVNIGLFTGAMGDVEEDFLYPVIGNSYIFLDRIPLGEGTEEDFLPIRGQYKEQFIKDQVWPVFYGEMLRNETPLTVSIPMVNVSDTLPDLRQTDFLMGICREVIDGNGEITVGVDCGKTGALHFAENVNSEFKIRFPKYDLYGMSRVSGEPDPEQEKQILEYFPKTRAIRRELYAQEQEYNFHTYTGERGETMVPVYSSGTGKQDPWIWEAAMSISARGCLSHKLDMSEMVDFKNGTKGWEEKEEALHDFWKRGPQKADWLSSVTLSEGIAQIRGYEALEYDVFRRELENELIILPKQYRKGQKFYLQTDKKIVDCTGGRVEKLDHEYYILSLESDQMTLRFEEKKGEAK